MISGGMMSGGGGGAAGAGDIEGVDAGAGLTGGGTSGSVSLAVGANADGSITVNANDIQVGILASDAQHGNRGGGGIHANAIAGGAAGFMTGADKTKLDGIEAGANVTKYRFNIVTFIAASPANATSHGYYSAANTNYPYWVAPRACTLTGISVSANGPPAGSAPLFRLTKTQVADSTLTLTGAAGATRHFWTTGTGCAVAAGDRVSACIITDASWTSTTLTWVVTLEFEVTL